MHRLILLFTTKDDFIVFHQRWFCRFPPKMILLFSTKDDFVVFHQRWFCCFPPKMILFFSTKDDFVVFHQRWFCCFPPKMILFCARGLVLSSNTSTFRCAKQYLVAVDKCFILFFLGFLSNTIDCNVNLNCLLKPVGKSYTFMLILYSFFLLILYILPWSDFDQTLGLSLRILSVETLF